MIKLTFCLQINTKVFYKIVSLWVCVARHAQSTENNKFTISLQYVKENVKDEVDFLPADKCLRFLRSDTITLGVCGQAFTITQNNKFAISLQYVKKEVVMQLSITFCMQISMKACYKLILTFFDADGLTFPKSPK